MKLYGSLLSIVLLLSACAQKKDASLAHNYMTQATTESQSGNYRKAIQLLDESIKFCPTPKAECLKATLLCHIGDDESSVTLFKKIINDKKVPKAMRADAKNNCAQALYKLGNEEEAMQLWDELCCDTDYVTPELAYVNLALVHMNAITNLEKKGQTEGPKIKEHLEKAVYNLKRALGISKDYIDAHFYLANVYLRQNNLAQSKESLIALLGCDPEHAPALELLTIVEGMISQHTSSD